MGTSIGSAFLMLGANTAEFKRGLDGASKKLTQFEKNLQGKIRTLQKFGAAATKAGKALSIGLTAPIIALGAASVMAFDKQIKAEKSLEVALGRVSEKLLEQASAIQKRTRIGDEAIIQGQAFLAQMGLEEEAILKLSPLIVDMAEGKGMDLKSAFDLVAKSVGSSTNALTRYGIEISGAVGSSERLNSAVDALTEKFGGQAEAIANVGLGPLIKLQNAFGDLLEDFGDIITEAINPFIDKIREAVLWMEDLDPATKKIIVVVAGLAAALGPALLLLGILTSTIMPLLIAQFTALTWPITLVALAIAAAAFLIITNWDTIVQYFTVGEGVQMFDAFMSVVDNVMDAFVALWDLASGAVMSLWGLFGDDIERSTGSFMEGVVSFITNWLNFISSYFGAFASLFKGNWSDLWEEVKTMLLIAFGNIPSIIVGLLADVLDSISGMVGKVREFLEELPEIPLLSKITGPILEMTSALEKGLKKGGDAVRGLSDELKVVIDDTEDLSKAVEDVGKEAEKTEDKVKGAFSGASKDTKKTKKTLEDINKELARAATQGKIFGSTINDVAKKQMAILKKTIIANTDEWGRMNKLGNDAFAIYKRLELQMREVKKETVQVVEEVAKIMVDDPFEGWVKSLKDVGSAVASIFDAVLQKVEGMDIIGALVSGNIVGAAGALVGGVVSRSDANREAGEGPTLNAMDKLLGKFNEAMMGLFDTLIPVLDAVFEALTPLVGVLSDVIGMFGNLLSNAIKPLAVALSIVSDILTEHFLTLIEQMKPMIDLYADIAPEFGRLLKIVKPLAGPLTKLLGAFIKLQSMFNPAIIQLKLLGIFMKVLNNILEPFLPTIEMFANKLERSVDLFDNWLDGATDLGGLFKFLTEKVLPAIISVGLWLGKTFSFLGEIINKFVVPVFSFFAKAVKSIVEGIVGIINSVIKKINDLFKTDINTIDLGGLSLASTPASLDISAPNINAPSVDLSGISTGGNVSTGRGSGIPDINLSGTFIVKGDDLVLVFQKAIRRRGFGGIGGFP